MAVISLHLFFVETTSIPDVEVPWNYLHLLGVITEDASYDQRVVKRNHKYLFYLESFFIEFNHFVLLTDEDWRILSH